MIRFNKMLERLTFSIPVSVTINAPADVVWETLTDIASHPNTFTNVVDATLINRGKSATGGSSDLGSGSGAGTTAPRRASSTGSASVDSQTDGQESHPDSSGAGTTARRASFSRSASADSQTNSQDDGAFVGSKWKFTRASVLENQRYSAKATVTQCTREDGRRSYTMSTHQMLGATCSLKMIVEPVASSAESCQVTAIMTMIPYQFFVKLLGVMCCLCLLKQRARIAMECDLEDLTIVCEGMVEHRRGNSGEERKYREEERDEADAAAGMSSLGLGTIIEEDCSGC